MLKRGSYKDELVIMIILLNFANLGFLSLVWVFNLFKIQMQNM